MKKRNIFKGLVLTLVGAISIVSCKPDTKSINQEPPLPVKVMQAAFTELPGQFEFTGKVISDEKTFVSTRLLGNIESIPDVGDPVKKGQVILKIRDREIVAKLGSARASLDEANAALLNTRMHFDRINRLYEKGSATQSEFDNNRAAVDIAEARVKGMEHKISELEELIRFTRVTSPIDGFVAQRMANPGDMASPGNPVLVLESLDRLKIEIDVPEIEIGLFEVKAPVKISVVALGGLSYDGWVDKVIPSSEYSGSQYKVTIRFQAVDGLKPGMFTEVSLEKGSEQKILIPRSAVHNRGQLTGLYGINQNGEAMLRWVRLGKEYPEGIEVISGLEPGERVIFSAEGKVFDGARIKVTEGRRDL